MYVCRSSFHILYFATLISRCICSVGGGISGGGRLSAVLSTFFWAEFMAVRALERAGVHHHLDL